MNRSDQLHHFAQKLLEWNRVHNLTGAKDLAAVQANIADSLKPLQFLQGPFHKAIDVGTGAGFPGLVLAIAMPETSWYLVEPRKKRAAFLHYVASSLGLENVTIIPKRIEELSPFPADLITSRALMKAPDLLKLVAPFTTPQTTILLYKGSQVHEELEGIPDYRLIPNGKRTYLLVKGSNHGQDTPLPPAPDGDLLPLLQEEKGDSKGDDRSKRNDGRV
ncbi:MAG: 16S rRNA (guanine(527)-N(7))-methyltransferase RsmG [Nitratiruptor sp.]|nr:16S rRNA (guanine(527)-N(7))-methyltransferase RsmG [Nitratiruptor sp.]NPA83479.1 16S rRNA (guanine(527)-N(7))-methyltransferase RsmG [Campylobacterota bacterium]